jgi:transcriptional regulator with XRE-family HTH domain
VEDIKSIIAKNITALRQGAKMTQIELAERLNYSDKSVSKWERAESLPDITVLKAIADMFEVPLDYLVRENPELPPIQEEPELSSGKKRNHKVITALSILLVWFVAAVVFVILDMVELDTKLHFLAFAYALPVSMIVWLVLNSVWFSRRYNYLIISLLMWTTLGCTALLLQLLCGISFWQMIILGALGQIIIATWSKMQYHQKKK